MTVALFIPLADATEESGELLRFEVERCEDFYSALSFRGRT